MDTWRPNVLAAIVFDFDGVIVDSESAHYEAHRRIYERCGVTLTRDDWCNQVGIPMDGVVSPWVIRLRKLSPDAPDPERFVEEKRRLFDEIMSRQPMRGIAELADAAVAAGVALAVASASPAWWVVKGLERVQLHHRFDILVTGDDVRRVKPAPDLYVEALSRLNVPASRAVAIEDSAPGIMSARAAGLATVAIPHWLTRIHDLSAADLQVAHAGELTVEGLDALVLRLRGDS
jgi:HAD superfamily hydrolase (TIGR01509 family)